MKKMQLVAMFLGCLGALQSCLPCQNVDCADSDQMQVLFRSAADSLDLFRDSSYSIDSLQITELLEDNNQAPYGTQITSTDTDHFIDLFANDNTLGYVLKVGSLQADTLFFQMDYYKDGCCVGAPYIQSVVFGQDTLLPENAPIELAIYK